MKEEYIDIKEYRGNGYQPLVDFENWRVAILRNDKNYVPEGIEFLERHNETDEIFVLLEGSCLLYYSKEENQPGGIQGFLLEKEKIYNVKKDVWHTAALSGDACVLIVENADTTYDNSDVSCITNEQREELLKIAIHLGFEL